MENLNTALKAFWQDEAGLTMVEYAIAGTLVTLGAVTAFTTLGNNVSAQIGNLAERVGTGA